MYKSYSSILNREKPDFTVKYKAIGNRVEKGLFQGIRTNFMYAEDENVGQSYIIFPEFLDENGQIITDKVTVDIEGTANMWIVFPETIDFHKAKLKINGKGYLMEGNHKIAECEIISIN